MGAKYMKQNRKPRNYWNLKTMNEYAKTFDYNVIDITRNEKSSDRKELYAFVKCPIENHENYWVRWNSFLCGCRCAKCLLNYKYFIGQIIITNCRKLEILNLSKQLTKHGNMKSYKYKCLICDFIGEISEYNLNKGVGCSACHSRSVHIGFNDINTTNFKIASLLLKKEEAFLYTQYSHYSTDWICENCGNIIRNKKIKNVVKYGLSCNLCGRNGISYPEKLLNNILNNIGCKFETQKIFDWSKRKKYDIYIDEYNLIIEIMGGQHKKVSFELCGGRSLEEEINNDKFKKELALNNGIENYIVIDAEFSDLEFIKNNILNSDLSKFFDFSIVDWKKCNENALNNIAKETWNLWNKGNNINSIILQLNLSRSSVKKYLKLGNSLNKCSYIPVENFEKIKRKCVCINTNEIFLSIKNAGDIYNVHPSTIASNCRGERKHAGICLKTGEKLIWEFYDEEKHKNFKWCEIYENKTGLD